MTLPSSVVADARVLWDHLSVPDDLPAAADFVLAAGCHSDRVAEHAARLVAGGLAPRLAVSGDRGRITASTAVEPEAARYRRIALASGVADDRVLVEDRATNTGENVRFTRALLAARGLRPATGVLVTHGYKVRRARATAWHQWPEVRWWVTAPPGGLDAHLDGSPDDRRLVELLAGEAQRLLDYPALGYFPAQDVPEPVQQALAPLVAAGFTRHLPPA